MSTEILFEAWRHVADVALDSIELLGIDSPEKWEAWCAAVAPQIEEEGDLFATGSTLLTDRVI